MINERNNKTERKKARFDWGLRTYSMLYSTITFIRKMNFSSMKVKISNL